MATTMGTGDIIGRCNQLQKDWSERNTKFKEWYELIEMVDNLKQKNMESFVGNDPRASYNLMSSMLNQTIPHRIDPSKLSQEHIKPAGELANLYSTAWEDIQYKFRQRGRYWQTTFIGLLLATGWYSVFSIVADDGTQCVAEILNPATVYPDWDDVLFECAHIYSISGRKAMRLAYRNGWSTDKIRANSTVTVFDYWHLNDAGQVMNAIVLDKELVKSDQLQPRFNRIPIFTSPCGGLPDMGEITQDKTKWRREIGMSALAANENIYRYWNKWWSFSMQLLRDTAQARTYEKTASSSKIVKPEEWFKRGAHFKLGPNDDLGFIQPPAIPIELRSAQLDMEAMMQRGGPSWAMFGNIQQQMTAYVMSQIASSANQTTQAYHHGIQDCITDIDNFWLYLIREHKYKPYGIGLPSGLPPEAKITADYEMRIPGDLVQRATTARMLNPDFTLSNTMIMQELFPEIKNPMEEQARVRADQAQKHPVRAAISLIESFREEAELLSKARDTIGSNLYSKAADLIEASITNAPQPQNGTAGLPPSGPSGAGAPAPGPGVVPPPGSEQMM